ncbi:MAG: cytochrome c biogenesis protein CcdA [Oscillospiraceae bacterium]|nr:cytochrome c biogenesis protein CcdA [Oscillospiraceae bacterium]
MQFVVVFLEGIITFISPCLLPMLPIYLSYFAGGGERNRKKTVVNAIGFILGFSLVFILMGVFASTIGTALRRYHSILNVILGGIVVFLGLNYLGVFRFNLFRGGVEKADTRQMTFAKSVLFGIVFAVGWTPCVGTFLGSALMLAGNQKTVVQGAVLLLVYSLGLGIPFLVSAILLDEVKSAIKWIKQHYSVINRVSGVFLVIVGLLMCFGWLDRVLAVLQ